MLTVHLSTDVGIQQQHLNQEPLLPVQATSQIIYASIRPNSLGIYHCSQDGKNIRLLSQSNRFETHPTPTPDGKGMIYSSNGAGSHHLYYRSIEEGKVGEEWKLTHHTLFEGHPHFDCNGYLYFTSDIQGSTHIYRIQWEGQPINMEQAEKITEGTGNNFSFCVSPDGKEIVFCSNQDNLESYQGAQPKTNYQAGRLYIMTLGQPETCRPLIPSVSDPRENSWEGTPTYSKDGQYIFYYSTCSGKPQLYRYDTQNKQQEKMTVDHAKALYPFTSVENQILFSYQKIPAKPWKIKSMQTDGTGLKTLVKIQQHCWAPQSLQDGSFLFYGTTNLNVGTLPIEDKLSHGEGSLVVDEGVIANEEQSVAIKTIRGYFPTAKNQQKIYYIELMTKMMQCNLDGSDHEELFDAIKEEKAPVFGLSDALDGTLVTSIGVPFEKTISHIVLFPPEQGRINLTAKHPHARNVTPTISDDGKRIIFSRQEPGKKQHLFSMNREGNELVQLTFDDCNDVFPSISQCGERVVYSSTKDGKTYHLRLLDLKKGEITTLTEGSADIHASFSPDGDRLVFSSNRGGHKIEGPLSFFFNPQPYGDIWTLDLNSRKVTQLTSSPYEDSLPTWIAVRKGVVA